MTTERHAWGMGSTTRPATTDDGRTTQPVCACGQDLDVCTGRHCPRCGTSLFAHAA